MTLYAPQRGALRVVASSIYPAGAPLAEVVAGRIEPHDPHADHQALLQLAAWCERFSPCVGVDPPDNLYLDVTGLEALFGDEEHLLRLVAHSFQRMGATARLAVADTLGEAWALAHFSDGRQTLEDLPVAALRLGAEVELLAELGVKRIKQLLQIPRDALAARFDSQVLLRLDQAVGNVAEPIVSHRPPPEIIVETRPEYTVDDRQAIDRLLAEVIERTAAQLAQRQQGAIRLACELECESRTVRFEIGLYRASAKPVHLFELAQMQLDRTAIPGPVVSVKLAVLISAPLETRQQELFESSQREDRRRVDLLIDRLSNRLGRGAVVQALPLADAQPELAVWYEPLTGMQSRASRQRWKPLPRPLRLERQPEPLQVLSIIPDGPPIRFHWQGLHTVARHWGPERIQTGWWRGRYVQRDYYRVETDAGRRFWLFRSLPEGHWFLHGVFD